MILKDEFVLKDSDITVKIEIDFDDPEYPIRFAVKNKWMTEAQAKQLNRYLNKIRKIWKTRTIP